MRLQLVAGLLLSALLNVTAQTASRFGLVAGRVNTYVGTAQWTDSAGHARSSPVHWRMEVLAVQASSDARGALVRGWVQDLAWYTPAQRPAFSVLLERRGRLYAFTAPDSSSAVDTLVDAVRDASRVARGFRLVIDSSMVVGHVFGGDTERNRRSDAMYAWLVESRTKLSGRPQWLPLAWTSTGWQLAYRTLPDLQVVEFVPGIGITRFRCDHHGTVATADVRLITVTLQRR